MVRSKFGPLELVLESVKAKRETIGSTDEASFLEEIFRKLILQQATDF